MALQVLEAKVVTVEDAPVTASFGSVCIGGVWKVIADVKVAVSGAWKVVTEAKVAASGAWKTPTA